MVHSKVIYEELLEKPGNAHTMRILADVLDEEGQEDLATAFRYAADRGLWPFERWDRRSEFGTLEGNVYDWESDKRNAEGVKECSRLPHSLWKAILNMKDKKYGSVWDAFVLLARALREQGTVNKLGG